MTTHIVFHISSISIALSVFGKSLMVLLFFTFLMVCQIHTAVAAFRDSLLTRSYYPTLTQDLQKVGQTDQYTWY